MTHLLLSCLSDDDELRPSSAIIVDEMDAHLTAHGSYSGMLVTVMDNVIEWNTSTSSKGHRRRLKEEV